MSQLCSAWDNQAMEVHLIRTLSPRYSWWSETWRITRGNSGAQREFKFISRSIKPSTDSQDSTDVKNVLFLFIFHSSSIKSKECLKWWQRNSAGTNHFCFSCFVIWTTIGWEYEVVVKFDWRCWLTNDICSCLKWVRQELRGAWPKIAVRETETIHVYVLTHSDPLASFMLF